MRKTIYQRLEEIKMKRNIKNCLLFFPEIQTPISCSHPEKKKCGLHYVYLRPIQGEMKPWFKLCAYRVREIGLDACLKEKMTLKELKE